MKNNKLLKKAITMIAITLISIAMIGGTSVSAEAATEKEVQVKITRAGKRYKKKLALGKSLRLTVKNGKKVVKPKKAKYKSSNKSIVKVSKKGVITPQKVGKAVITVKYKKKTARITIKVFRAVKSVSLDRVSAKLKVGEKIQLNETVLPKKATNKAVVWSTSDKSVAKVKNGVVTARAKGTAVITATTVQGQKTASCTIKVTVPVKSVALNKKKVKMYVGKKYTLKETVYPKKASVKTVTWSSSNTKVATVKDGVVTAKKAGKAIITVTTKDGKKQASCTVKVRIPVKKITLNKNVANVDVGYNNALEAKVSPANATDKTLTWKSANKSIATVDSNGIITGNKVGTTTVTVTATSGVKATCKVVVSKVVEHTIEEVPVPDGPSISDIASGSGTITIGDDEYKDPSPTPTPEVQPGTHGVRKVKRYVLVQVDQSKDEYMHIYYDKYFANQNCSGEDAIGYHKINGTDYIVACTSNNNAYYSGGSLIDIYECANQINQKFGSSINKFFIPRLEMYICGEYDIEEFQKYSSADDFIKNGPIVSLFMTDSYYYEKITSAIGKTNMTYNDMFDLLNIWAKNVDLWQKNGKSMRWEYLINGNSNFNFFPTQTGVTAGYWHLGGSGNNFPGICNEVEVWEKY